MPPPSNGMLSRFCESDFHAFWSFSRMSGVMGRCGWDPDIVLAWWDLICLMTLSNFGMLAILVFGSCWNNFVNSLSKPCTGCTRNVVWVWYTSQVLYNTQCHTPPCSSLQLSAKHCPLQRYLFGELVDPSILHMKTVVYLSKIFVEIVSRTVENSQNSWN